MTEKEFEEHMEHTAYLNARGAGDSVAMSRDALLDIIRAAYVRGGNWMHENKDPEYLAKAAYDYADKATSQMEG